MPVIRLNSVEDKGFVLGNESVSGPRIDFRAGGNIQFDLLDGRDGRWFHLHSCRYVRQEMQIIPLITKCEQNKNDSSLDYDLQPRAQRGQSRFASSTDNSR